MRDRLILISFLMNPISSKSDNKRKGNSQVIIVSESREGAMHVTMSASRGKLHTLVQGALN
jgi:hypothetical protein